MLFVLFTTYYGGQIMEGELSGARSITYGRKRKVYTTLLLQDVKDITLKTYEYFMVQY